jgi:hypothetical protein
MNKTHSIVLFPFILAFSDRVDAAGARAEVFDQINNRSIVNEIDINSVPPPLVRIASASFLSRDLVGKNIASASAQSSFGGNLISAVVGSRNDFPAGVSPPYGQVLGSSAYSFWNDKLTVNTAVSAGFLEFRLYLRGSFFTNAAAGVENFGRGEYYFTAESPDYGPDKFSFERFRPGSPFGGNYLLRLPFGPSGDISVESLLRCDASAAGIAIRPVSSGCGAQAYWGGITRVIDLEGNSVAGWTLRSLSGTNYYQNFAPFVPEPATWMSLIFGFGAIGSMMRLQRASLHR